MADNLPLSDVHISHRDGSPGGPQVEIAVALIQPGGRMASYDVSMAGRPDGDIGQLVEAAKSEAARALTACLAALGTTRNA